MALGTKTHGAADRLKTIVTDDDIDLYSCIIIIIIIIAIRS
jgi:hypothetical protein